MQTYMSLMRFTQRGIEKIKESPARLGAARKTYEVMGARLKEFDLVTGRYDAVVVSEAPNDEVMARLALTLASHGSVHTETLRAFTETEYRQIVAALQGRFVHPMAGRVSDETR